MLAFIILITSTLTFAHPSCSCDVEVDGFGPGGDFAPRPVTDDTELNMIVTVQNTGQYTGECDYEVSVVGHHSGTVAYTVDPAFVDFTVPVGGDYSFAANVEIGEEPSQQSGSVANTVGALVTVRATGYRASPDDPTYPIPQGYQQCASTRRDGWLHAEHEAQTVQEGFAIRHPLAAGMVYAGYSPVGLFRFWAHSEHEVSNFLDRWVRERRTQSVLNYDSCYDLAMSLAAQGLMPQTKCESALDRIPVSDSAGFDWSKNRWRLKGTNPNSPPEGTNSPNDATWDSVGYSCSCARDYMYALSVSSKTSDCGFLLEQIMEMDDGQPSTSGGKPAPNAEWAAFDVGLLGYTISEVGGGTYKLRSSRRGHFALDQGNEALVHPDPNMNVLPCSHTWSVP